MDLDTFISSWTKSGGAERANYQLFLTQLCDQLNVAHPEPSQTNVEENAYVFERDVTFQHSDGSNSIGRIDLYKRGCFLLEAKQGSDAQRAEEEAQEALAAPGTVKPKKKGAAVRGTKAWDDAMVRARGQADRYARALPTSEGWPPFLIVVDVGHCIELYSEFTRSGRTYVPFPDPQSYRINLGDLKNEVVRERLKAVWVDPLSLDPSRRSAKVTRELAQRLAALAKLLESAKHDPALVARFLMRCLFTMFAEDVELLPRGSFKELLTSLKDEPDHFKPMVEALWQTMNAGGFSPILRKQILRFNGGLFADSEALPLTKPMLELLTEAAASDWADVEPAIFGTLLERALDPIERHKLGAHYTPRAYVERLVMPTIIEPLREEWNTTYAAAVTHAQAGELNEAQEEVRTFHNKLCETRVLDPACGSANFLYVTLEHMKRLEGEVLNALREFGDKQAVLLEVDPHQFLGIEINPRAAAIAELVLWIGYLQWHFRTRGKAQPAEPIIKDYKNIECRDAVLAWDSTEPLLDDAGNPVTRWDGRTTKTHPVTGEQVPDETARIPVLKYINPRKADWPKADYVVGNPPFIGNKYLRKSLGDGYVDSLRMAHLEVPDTSDLVMYWWNHVAQLIKSKNLNRFGLIATNSIRQTQNRKLLSSYLNGDPQLSLLFAIPDHPWIDSTEGAAVRISMTVGCLGKRVGALANVIAETASKEGHIELLFDWSFGKIGSNLTVSGSDTEAVTLKSNKQLSCPGVKLHGSGFIVNDEEAKSLGIGKGRHVEKYIRSYRNGRDIAGQSRNVRVIDLFGLTEDAVRKSFPEVYQWVLNRVKPEREHNNRPTYRNNWWIFGEPRADFRPALYGLQRYIVTPVTAKHRFFTFLPIEVLPDDALMAIATDKAELLGVLSSHIHKTWAINTGSTLEDRPRYIKSDCFEKFPFPDCPTPLKARIRALGEQLDAHRKRQQDLHPKLTLTDMYNVLEKLRSGEALTAKEKKTHEEGLVAVLKQIHDDLDAAVFEAYGWPANLTDEEILERLVALNAERHAEEERGLIRWLRPEFQKQAGGTQQGLALETDEADADEDATPTKGKNRASKKGAAKVAAPKAAKKKSGKVAKQPWPRTRVERTKGVQAVLASGGSLSAAEVTKRFVRGNEEQVEEILDALVALGQAHYRGGKYSA